jgi:hypothetical protein
LGDLNGGTVGKNVVHTGGEPLLVRVEVGDDGKLDGIEVALLNEGLGTHADIDTGGVRGGVAAAVHVAGSKAERRQTGVDIVPAVVVVGDLQLSGVLIAVAVRVTNERSLPLKCRDLYQQIVI